MIRKTLLFLTIPLIFATGVGAQSVVVTSKKVTYTRKNSIADFKRTFVVNYPVVKAATPAISRKIEAALSYEKLLCINIKEEMSEIQWLEEADFEVTYNKNGVLGVSVFMEGSGAYPSGQTLRVVIDSRTGTRLTPALAFRNGSGLMSMVRKDMDKEIADAIKRIRSDPESSDFDAESQFREGAEFHKLSLDEFSVDDDGITFYHDYGFPHVAKALQPDGEFKYRWGTVKPFLKPGGLLLRIAR